MCQSRGPNIRPQVYESTPLTIWPYRRLMAVKFTATRSVNYSACSWAICMHSHPSILEWELYNFFRHGPAWHSVSRLSLKDDRYRTTDGLLQFPSTQFPSHGLGWPGLVKWHLPKCRDVVPNHGPCDQKLALPVFLTTRPSPPMYTQAMYTQSQTQTLQLRALSVSYCTGRKLFSTALYQFHTHVWYNQGTITSSLVQHNIHVIRSLRIESS